MIKSIALIGTLDTKGDQVQYLKQAIERNGCPVMVIDCSRLVPKSLAVTLTIPLASIENLTSICGMPRGAGGIPSK